MTINAQTKASIHFLNMPADSFVLDAQEQQALFEVFNSERFCDIARRACSNTSARSIALNQ